MSHLAAAIALPIPSCGAAPRHAARARRATFQASERAASTPPAGARPDPRLDEALKVLLAVGAVVVLLWPGARGSVASIGWLPMWLLGMPLVALWALHGFRVPWAGRTSGRVPASGRRRPAVPQARRRRRTAVAAVRTRAA